MNQDDDPEELARKLNQAARMVSGVGDETTYGRLREWIAELKQGLQRRQDTRWQKLMIRARARELWEQNRRPSGRDEEFWLQAEAEIRSRVTD